MSNTNFSLISPHTFNGENYPIWSVKMKCFLKAQDLWEIVEEDRPVTPLGRDPTLAQIKAHTEEKTKRSKAKTLLQNSVSDAEFTKIMIFRTTKEVWDKLKLEYQGR